MIKIIFLLFFIIAILFVLKNNSNNKSKIYKRLIFLVIVLGILFIIATSGKFILPQLLQIFKMGLPIVTRLIGL